MPVFYLSQAALSIFGMVGGPLLGLFTLGMFFPWANYIVSTDRQGIVYCVRIKSCGPFGINHCAINTTAAVIYGKFYPICAA